MLHAYQHFYQCNKFKINFLLIIFIIITATSSFACTRILKYGNHSTIVGRTMDWSDDMNTMLIVYPRGISHTGSQTANALRWTSKYGSIVATAYNLITTDGMNERGLAANMLWLDESDYGTRNENLPGLSIQYWVQYYLDNFQSVDEAVKFTESSSFQLLPYWQPKISEWVTVHLSLEDASGDSAIIEYVNGIAHIYHNRSYIALTNSPTYDLQIKHLSSYQQYSNDHPLPGTTNSVDRFIRANFYAKRLSSLTSTSQQISELRSVINNVAQPYGEPTPERDGISPTIWSVISDLTHKVYYFHASTSLNSIWAKLDKFNLQQGAPVLYLDLSNVDELSGDVSDKFQAANM